MRSWFLLLVVVATACCGCGPEPLQQTSTLIDSEHGAAVLTETGVLSDPRSVAQNRLLRGWRFVRQTGRRPLIKPTGAASVVELTRLESRRRSLVIGLVENPSDGTVSASVANGDLGSFALSKECEIPLPLDLPPGRTCVTLVFSDPDRTTIERVQATDPRPAGATRVDPSGLKQSGWSAIEIARRVSGSARFIAEFQPPENPHADQRFSLTIERDPGVLVEVFHWSTAGSDGTEPPQTLDVELGPAQGFVRFRFVAVGPGPAATWVRPRVVELVEPARAPSPPDLGDPPRLVVLYVMDALRSDHVGRAGLTPVLDALARDGARFVNHFAVAPNTPPSTRALFSGLTMLDERNLPHPGPTRIAEVFRDAGFRTASISGNPHLSADLDLAVGFDTIELLPVDEDHRPEAAPTVNRNAESLHEAALAWVERLAPGERGFLYLHTMNPHNPYVPPPEIEAAFAPPGPSDIDGRTRTLVAIRDMQKTVDQNDQRRLRQLYASGVAYNDRELGRFLRALGHHVDPEDVLLIATSDHGEELFEHGGVLHGHTLYDELLRIPLVVHWPGRLRSQTVVEPTTTLDLHATLLELAGGSSGSSIGTSLWPGLTASTEVFRSERLVFAAAPGIEGATMVRSARRKLIMAPRNGARRGMGHGLGRSRDVEYVFDLATDPDEHSNLAGAGDLEVAWLRSRLLGWTATQQELQPRAGGQLMSDVTRSRLEALGYSVD